jgi:flagellar biogenesis protein FliO
MSIALIVVLGTFFFVVFLVKKFGGKSTFLLDQRFGKIIGRMQLAPKTSLYWVRLPDRILVVGTTPNAISCLTEITDPKVLAEFGVVPGETEQTTAAFGKYLDRFHKRFERRKPVEERLGVAEHLEDLRSELEKIKEFSEGIDGEERG